MKIVRFALILFLLCSFAFGVVIEQKGYLKPTNNTIGLLLDLGSPRLDDSLRAWWLFNEGSGGRVDDVIGGNGMSLANMDNPSTASSGWNPSRVGVGLVFDGVDDFVSGDFFDGIGGSFTFAAWIRADSTGDSNFPHVIQIDQPGGGGANQLSLDLDFNQNEYELNYYGSQLTFSRDPDLDIGKWQHFAGVFDDSTDDAYLYLNGILVASQNVATVGTLIDPAIVTIGLQNGEVRHWHGAIDDVRVSNRPLSQGEIQDWMVNPYIEIRTCIPFSPSGPSPNGSIIFLH